MGVFLVLSMLLLGGASYDQCATDEMFAGDWDGYKVAMEDGKSRWKPDEAKRCK